MLRSVAICPDRKLLAELVGAVSASGCIKVSRTVEFYPADVELARMLRAHGPQVVFLGIENPVIAARLAVCIEQNLPGVQVVAIDRQCDPQRLIELMRSGVREFLSPPFKEADVLAVVRRLKENAEKRPVAGNETDMVFSFLPSKPGVGATTLAVNAAIALSRTSDINVLLADLDLNSGMIRFMLKLENNFSITDAADRALDMDENLWPQLVSKLGRLDVLHAGTIRLDQRIETMQVRALVDFARRNYRAVCIDLSGNMEKYSFEIMQECKRVFLVCTPEVPSLHLAREKFTLLRSVDLGDRVSVLLNRTHKRSVITPAQIERLLGLPVFMSFANDYQEVHRALTLGRQVEPATELGRQFVRLAENMLARPSASPERHKKRFIEYFSILPGRYSLSEQSKKPVS